MENSTINCPFKAGGVLQGGGLGSCSKHGQEVGERERLE